MLTPENALVFLNLSNLLYIVCYAVRDVLWLRVFCVIAILTIMPYYIWGMETTQMVCISWNLVFFAINLFWIIVIVKQRRPPKMTDDEKRLYAEVFSRSCSEQEMLWLLSASEIQEVAPDQHLINENSSPNGLILIDSGTANVVLDRKLIATLGRGDFVGEMSYLTGEPAVADVQAATGMKIIRWERSELTKLFEGRPELKSSINEIIGVDLVRKIVSSEPKVPELTVDTLINDG